MQSASWSQPQPIRIKMTTFSTAKTGGIGTIILCWFSPMTLRLIGCTVLLLTLPCFGQSSMERRLWALEQVEAGSDTKPGPCGEVSRYQILPTVWRQYAGNLPISASMNPFTAKNVATRLLEARTGHFRRIYHRQPTDYETGLLWHCPGAIRHPNAEQRDFAQRFANLCQKPLANP